MIDLLAKTQNDTERCLSVAFKTYMNAAIRTLAEEERLGLTDYRRKWSVQLEHLPTNKASDLRTPNMYLMLGHLYNDGYRFAIHKQTDRVITFSFSRYGAKCVKQPKAVRAREQDSILYQMFLDLGVDTGTNVGVKSKGLGNKKTLFTGLVELRKKYKEQKITASDTCVLITFKR